MHRTMSRVAVALTAATATLIVVGLQHGHPSDPLAGNARSSGEADRRALLMLDRTYVIGAVRVAAPRSVRDSTIESDVVQHRRWYTVAGSLGTVVALVRANPPAGFSVSNQLPSSATAPGAGAVVEFEAAAPDTGSIDVAVVPLSDSRVSLRLEAVVGWTSGQEG